MTMLGLFTALLGGLGLFLVGMWLMTDGLKLMAGSALRRVLEKWTNTPLRGWLAGFGLTTLVQHSGGVSVAVIGFTSAGLLTLQRAAWVIFGSNVGTTTTSWIVAAIGFKLDMEAYALPLVGVGMALRMVGETGRRAHIGQVLVGFGLFFMGIGVLKDAFGGVGAELTLPGVDTLGHWYLLVYFLIGVVLTTLMQSSSASLVIVLGAAQGGLLPLSAAAAAVIGANLGSTTTALISVWGASAEAKRVASVHVAFNLVTASIAMIIINPMLQFNDWVMDLLQVEEAPVIALAAFHTSFNILGVLLMIPLGHRVIAFLDQRFHDADEIHAKPRYLNTDGLRLPALGMEQSLKEVARLERHVADLLRSVLDQRGRRSPELAVMLRNNERLALELGRYVSQLGSRDLAVSVATQLSKVVLVVQQYYNISNDMPEIFKLTEAIADEDGVDVVNVDPFFTAALAAIAAIETSDSMASAQLARDAVGRMESAYDALRQQLLQAGVQGRIRMPVLDMRLQQLRMLQRAVSQLLKNRRRQLRIATALT